MNWKATFCAVLCLMICVAPATAQGLGELAPWTAQWISHPEAPKHGPVVLHFRKEITIEGSPKSYKVLISADNRFVFYVNGQRVVSGPAWSEPKTWRYETVDLAPYLKTGVNVLSAEVWNFGSVRPMAQMSLQTGFFIQGKTAAESAADTGSHWQVGIETGRSASAVPMKVGDRWIGYYAAGPAEQIDGRKTNWDWQSGEGAWTNAVPVLDLAPSQSHQAPWGLTANPLPAQKYRSAEPGKVVRSDLSAARAFPRSQVTIPANRRVRFLIDRETMIAGYPQLTVSGGRDAEIKMTYAEALYDKDFKKADRNLVGDREAYIVMDSFIADGGNNRTFAPLWWRTWRYLALDITTQAEPLRLNGLNVFETGYPFEAKGWFRSNDTELNRIWEIGWRTALIDAHETYMDTAYWEQLQYAGDTRLQALISYAVAGDDRLAVQAIEAIGNSIGREGLTQSRYPSAQAQTIASFSLLWIGMVHDHFMYYPDRSVPSAQLGGVRRVLDRFRELRGSRGLLTRPPGWDWIDWAPGLEGQPAKFYDANGESCLTTLLYIGALQQAAELEGAVGDPKEQKRYAADAEIAAKQVHDLCWDAEKMLIADAPDKSRFSQHANTLAVLYGVVPTSEAGDLMRRIRTGPGLKAPEGVTRASYIWGHYMAQAEAMSGLGDCYGDLMQTWRDMLKLNLTTTPEDDIRMRSDTHAWSAHPTSDLIAIVAGIGPAEPGYASVEITPALGNLTKVDAAGAHPLGLIVANYSVANGKLRARLTLPDGLTGTFVWKGKRYPLTSGNTLLDIAL